MLHPCLNMILIHIQDTNHMWISPKSTHWFLDPRLWIQIWIITKGLSLCQWREWCDRLRFTIQLRETDAICRSEWCWGLCFHVPDGCLRWQNSAFETVWVVMALCLCWHKVLPSPHKACGSEQTLKTQLHLPQTGWRRAGPAEAAQGALIPLRPQ